ncbi:MAG: hypothetical protein AAF560_29480, partial [Acidobacteriota bacterium]
ERYHLIPISTEPEALVGRLRYVLSNTVKEFLVERVGDWDGLHSGIELMEGKPMKGVWYDRSKEYEARRQAKRKAARRGKPAEPISRGAFMEHYEVKLAPLPCWRNDSLATRRNRIIDMVQEIEIEAAAQRAELGIEPLGMDAIQSQNPFSRSANEERRPKPLCHAASKAMHDRVKKAYGAFVELFREASLKVKLGRVSEAIFPKHCFPPSLPFVRVGELIDPLADAGGVDRWMSWAPTSS